MIVYENLDLPGGGSPRARIEIELWGAGAAIAGRGPDGQVIAGPAVFEPNVEGVWSADLVPNGDIAPENTTYQVTRYIDCTTLTSYISVPASGGPFEAFLIGDDAMNEISGSALSGHAANNALHGGGTEVDFGELASTINVTGNASNLAVITGGNVQIPDVARPIYIYGQIFLVGHTSPVDVVGAIATWDGVTTVVGALAIVDAEYGEAIDNDAYPFKCSLMARVQPHSPGFYTLAARRDTSTYGVQVVSNSLFKTKIWAVYA